MGGPQIQLPSGYEDASPVVSGGSSLQLPKGYEDAKPVDPNEGTMKAAPSFLEHPLDWARNKLDQAESTVRYGDPKGESHWYLPPGINRGTSEGAANSVGGIMMAPVHGGRAAVEFDAHHPIKAANEALNVAGDVALPLTAVFPEAAPLMAPRIAGAYAGSGVAGKAADLFGVDDPDYKRFIENAGGTVGALSPEITEVAPNAFKSTKPIQPREGIDWTGRQAPAGIRVSGEGGPPSEVSPGGAVNAKTMNPPPGFLRNAANVVLNRVLPKALKTGGAAIGGALGGPVGATVGREAGAMVSDGLKSEPVPLPEPRVVSGMTQIAPPISEGTTATQGMPKPPAPPEPPAAVAGPRTILPINLGDVIIPADITPGTKPRFSAEEVHLYGEMKKLGYSDEQAVEESHKGIDHIREIVKEKVKPVSGGSWGWDLIKNLPGFRKEFDTTGKSWNEVEANKANVPESQKIYTHEGTNWRTVDEARATPSARESGRLASKGYIKPHTNPPTLSEQVGNAIRVNASDLTKIDAADEAVRANVQEIMRPEVKSFQHDVLQQNEPYVLTSDLKSGETVASFGNKQKPSGLVSGERSTLTAEEKAYQWGNLTHVFRNGNWIAVIPDEVAKAGIERAPLNTKQAKGLNSWRPGTTKGFTIWHF